MTEDHDLLTSLADLAATAGLAALGFATTRWWWLLAIAWSALTIRQISLTRRASRHRRHRT